MKKKITALFLMVLLCIAIATPTLATSDSLARVNPGLVVTPKGAITVSGSLSRVSGSNYKISATTRANQVENLTVAAYLYKVNGNTFTYIGGVSSSKKATSVTAETNVTLQSGLYELRIFGSGNTISNAAVSYRYTI